MIRLLINTDENRSSALVAFNKKIDKSIAGTRKAMDGRVKGLGKYFTKNIQENIKADGKNHISSGRLLASNATLVQLTGSREAQSGSIVNDIFTFNYTFPKNRGTEYGYAFGNVKNRLQNIDAVAKWVMTKGSLLKYYQRGKVLPITKPYQARSVALMMIRKGANKDRKYSVHNWYKISISDERIEKILNQLRTIWVAEWREQYNKS